MEMPEMDKNQLEALRNRVEEDFRRAEENYRKAEENYRLDIAAVEHLHRRFFGTSNGNSASEYSSSNGLNSKPPVTIPSPQPISAARANFAPLNDISASEYSPANGLNSKPATIQPPQPTSVAKAHEEWEMFKSIHK